MAYRRRNREFESVCELASFRAGVAFRTANALLPGATNRQLMRAARRILTICDGKPRLPQITENVIKDMFLRNSQCLSKQCPMLLFTEPLVREINCYFAEEEKDGNVG